MSTLEILYEDAEVVAINKPSGLLVHKTKIAKDAREFALQILRDQLGQHVYPIHRLDRGTSGVLLFAKTQEAASLLSEQLREHQFQKEYLVVIRGHCKEELALENPLKREKDGVYQKASTQVMPLKMAELPLPVGKYETSRYSLVKAIPKTGRTHQIRRHLAAANHPVIGDHPHGDHRHNKSFIRLFGYKQLLLHAAKLKFPHPKSREPISVAADFDYYWREVFEYLNWSLPTN